MLRGLLYRFPTMLKRLRDALTRTPPVPTPTPEAPTTPRNRLERLRVTDGVMQTLFNEYAEHRQSPRGDEEIGWILLGVWNDGEATALATLPAGAERDASAVHVRFNTDAQALAARILRQKDKRLQMIGVVHTHPGDMSYPSAGDLQGDSRWVSQLRQGEAVFGIGTASGVEEEGASFSWYALAAGETCYRPLPIDFQPGVDLGVPLRPIWRTIEAHAQPLQHVCSLFAKVQVGIMDESPDGLLGVRIGLGTADQELRLLLTEAEVRYYWERQGEMIAIEPHENNLERAIHLILAELVSEAIGNKNETRMLVES